MGARRKRIEAERKLAQETAKVVEKCGAAKRNGKPCGREAGWGTTHQGYGRCKIHGGSTTNGEVAAAKQEVKDMATPIRVSPGQAMAGVLHLSAGQLAYVTEKVRALGEGDVMTEFGVNAWIKLQRSLMHDTAKFAKIAADAGIDERMANLAEAQTLMIAKMFETLADELQFTKEQKALLGPALRRNLAAFALEGDAEENT